MHPGLKLNRSPAARERGAVAVEFALVLPILLALVFGIISFGVILAQQVTLNGAVRTGARFGSVNAYSGTHTCGAVVQTVRDAATTIGMDGAKVGVEVYLTGQPSAVCSYGPNSPVPSPLASPSPSSGPCADPTATVDSPDTLTVKATFDSRFLVPAPISGSSMGLKSSSSFQCEYNK